MTTLHFSAPRRPALRALALALPLALAGCALTPTWQRPAVPVPAAWDDAAGTDAAVSATWWQQFGSEDLNRLMAEALANNRDLAAAASRIEQSRASARISGAGLLPSVGVSANASRNRTDNSGSNSDRATASISYELDLWGGNSARRQAALARVDASRYSRDASALVLQADVAQQYFSILALRERLDIARRNLAAARELLTLVETRYENGAISALDVAQQRTSVLSIEAQIPGLEQSLKTALHALAVLLGKPPQGFAVADAALSDLSLPDIRPGQPSSLLERRPDIRQAEARLVAANADIGAARAALLPSLDLSASAGLTGFVTNGASTFSSLSAGLAQTLFAGGSLRAQVQLSEATRQELVDTYAQTVLVSLQEVQDSLVGVESSARETALREQTVTQASETYELSRLRYEAGAVDLLTVLDSQRTRLSAEDSLVQSRLARQVAAVTLFKALGGGWQSAQDSAE